MKLFYCEVDGGNFGDDMNEWFWEELFPEYKDLAPSTTMFGIGSILWRANFDGLERVLVMGSGSGYGVVPNKLPGNAEVGFVRGPRTAQLINLNPDMAITDPAAMMPTLGGFQDVVSNDEVVFIPHIGTAKLPLNWDGIADRAGVRYVSPAKNAHEVIGEISGARLVLAESMHGAIIADAFRVPWVPLSISPAFNEHKWLDWSDSLLLDIEFRHFLVGLKKSRALMNQVRSFVRGTRKFAHGERMKKHLPNGTHVAPTFSTEAKDVARKWVSILSPAIEAMLVGDLVRAKKSKPFQSSDAILRKRQNMITDRIDQVKNRLALSS